MQRGRNVCFVTMVRSPADEITCKGRSSDLSRCCAFPIILTSGKECIQQKETYSNWYCSGFAPDSLITVCSKMETYCSKLRCKDMLFFLIFKKRNKKTSATLVSVADAVICLLIVKGSRAAVNLLRKVNSDRVAG